MSFPFEIGVPYPCGAGHVICSEFHHDVQLHGGRHMRFTIEAYGDVFTDASVMSTTGPAAHPRGRQDEPQPHFVRDEYGREVAFYISSAGTATQVTPIRPPANPFLAPPAARTPACLIDAMCRRARFIQTPPPRETGA